MTTAKGASEWGIVLNFLLFVAKLVAGLISNSIALLSDAFHSLSDVLASVGIFFAVKIAGKPADRTHPFGHHRAEPLAAFVVAVLTALLGFEILITAIKHIITPVETNIGILAFSVLLGTMLVKTLMYYYFRRTGKRYDSPALAATGIDARNDISVSFIALVGVIGSYLGFPLIENLVAIIIAGVLFYVAYDLGRSNANYLLGGAPDKHLQDAVVRRALQTRGVEGVKAVRAHYIGNYVNLEIVILVRERMSVKRSHAIGVQVRESIQGLRGIERVFVHTDPLESTRLDRRTILKH